MGHPDSLSVAGVFDFEVGEKGTAGGGGIAAGAARAGAAHARAKPGRRTCSGGGSGMEARGRSGDRCVPRKESTSETRFGESPRRVS